MTTPSSKLTPREREVLSHVATGMTNQEVAGALCISDRTVGAHLKAIFDKLQVDNRTRAGFVARQRGIL